MQVTFTVTQQKLNLNATHDAQAAKMLENDVAGPREQARANFIVKASDKNLGEEGSRWYWRSHTILDGTWMLPNVDKVKG